MHADGLQLHLFLREKALMLMLLHSMGIIVRWERGAKQCRWVS